MTVNVTPHLNFRGDARAALEFYESAFGGDLVITTYRDMGNVQDPAEAEHIVWGQVVAANGFRVMAYDVPGSRSWSRGEDPFFVSVRGDDVEEITSAWKGLAKGATIVQPLGPSPWAALYGMLKDRFGVTWVMDVLGDPDPS
ncbi:VOC family protein [Glycomyces buryatensis]|uniref:VOC family protein n=1 Tax=Glycomyces buryatensis TaxID=2570927 RepID=A0A4S8QKM7_9ACTN|nr:VOC family protein [Glycomyces buryatensis]THV41989.1 VOC family protein [Glycomyces buryatensis]